MRRRHASLESPNALRVFRKAKKRTLLSVQLPDLGLPDLTREPTDGTLPIIVLPGHECYEAYLRFLAQAHSATDAQNTLQNDSAPVDSVNALYWIAEFTDNLATDRFGVA